MEISNANAMPVHSFESTEANAMEISRTNDDFDACNNSYALAWNHQKEWFHINQTLINYMHKKDLSRQRMEQITCYILHVDKSRRQILHASKYVMSKIPQ